MSAAMSDGTETWSNRHDTRYDSSRLSIYCYETHLMRHLRKEQLFDTDTRSLIYLFEITLGLM